MQLISIISLNSCGVVGFYVNSNVTLFDTNVSNLILQQFTVGSVYWSSFIGAAQAYGNNKLIIQNSNVYYFLIQWFTDIIAYSKLQMMESVTKLMIMDVE
ncbi:Hypothetical_protein [Hexamita inflata]|uniref:Hypothetical_protein n=1 Tax=Hexamita inflata TaxID=28002 RepID=A0AA86V5W7_9EUKA|nr:Hypothetical protein HINF_LOCUS65162 [Hexamita inflata]